MSREITDLAWEPDGTLHVTFLETRDIRCEGAVAIRQTARIVPTDQYADGIDAVKVAAQALLKDALSDWATSEPAELEIGAPVPTERTLADGVVIEEREVPDDADSEAGRNWAAIEADRAST